MFLANFLLIFLILHCSHHWYARFHWMPCLAKRLLHFSKDPIQSMQGLESLKIMRLKPTYLIRLFSHINLIKRSNSAIPHSTKQDSFPTLLKSQSLLLKTLLFENLLFQYNLLHHLFYMNHIILLFAVIVNFPWGNNKWFET